MSDGSIIIDTQIDTDGAEKGVKGLGGKLGNLAKGGLGAFVKGIAAASAALGVAGGASIKLASDLSEVQNVVDVTFGKNAGAINKWAKDAATSFGMSELQAKQFNGTMGAMLKSTGLTSDEVLKMSKSMVGLSGDMASFYNLDSEEAFGKIRAGISGETEPLKQLGINMSVANLEAFALAEGIKKPYKEMSQSEQTMLRFNFLMKASKDAQGDFARTSDGLANQLRIAKLSIQDLGSTIGTALLPMAQGAVSGLNDMVGQLKTAFNKDGFSGLVTTLGDVFSQIIVKIAEKAPEVINTAITVIQAFVTGIQNNLPLIVGAAIQIISSLVLGLIQMLPQLLQMGITILVELIKGIAQMLPELIPIAIEAILTLIDTLINNIDSIIDAGIQLLTGLAEGLINALPILIEKIPIIIEKLLTALANNLPKLQEMGIKLIVQLAIGLIKAIPSVIAAIPKIIMSMIKGFSEYFTNMTKVGSDLISNVKQAMLNKMSEFADIGRNIVKGVWNGITGMAGWLYKKVSGFCTGVINGFMKGFDEHSPSKIMRDLVGVNIVKGIGVGIELESPNLDKDIQSNIGNLVAKMQTTVDYETANTTAKVVAKHDYMSNKNNSSDTSNKGENTQTVIAKLIVDGKEFTQTVVAPNQAELEGYYKGR